jgi:DUF2934 family protein
MLKTPNTKSVQPKAAEAKSAEIKSAEIKGGKTKPAQPATSTIVTKSAARPTARKPATADADLQQRIQQRAYELWEKEGRPQGRERAHWQQAEREVQGRGAGGRA